MHKQSCKVSKYLENNTYDKPCTIIIISYIAISKSTGYSAMLHNYNEDAIGYYYPNSYCSTLQARFLSTKHNNYIIVSKML